MTPTQTTTTPTRTPTQVMTPTIYFRIGAYICLNYS